MVLWVGAARRLSRQRRGRRGLWDICLGQHRHLTSSPNLRLVLMPRLEDNGETMVSTPMGQVCIVVRRRRAVVEVTLGRVTVQSSVRSWGHRVVLSRVLQVRTTGREVATEVIVVVAVVGTVTANLHRLVLWSRRRPRSW